MKRTRDKRRRWLKNYMSKKKCIDCGNDNPVVLQFDHVRGEKKFAILYNGNHIEKKGKEHIKELIAEVRKCEVRCANCHKIKTTENKETGWPKRQQ